MEVKNFKTNAIPQGLFIFFWDTLYMQILSMSAVMKTSIHPRQSSDFDLESFEIYEAYFKVSAITVSVLLKRKDTA